MDERITGRFAPTPSGRMHLGNILCAMLAYLSARSKGGRFLLRIEDTDLPRCPKAAGMACIDDLLWLGFTWDEPPLWQSDRSDIYAAAVRSLQAKNAVYPCFCTRAQLHSIVAPNLGDTQYIYPGVCTNLTGEERAKKALLRTPSVRVRTSDEHISFTDGLYGKQTSVLNDDCGDFVIQRSDGLYGYQLAVVVDDELSGVNEVVRGRDIMSSTPRQMWLQQLLGYHTPQYYHIPLLTDAAGRRLAKRDHDLDLRILAKRWSPQQLLGMLAWSAGLEEEPEPKSLEQLIRSFGWDKIRTADMHLPAMIVDQE